VIEELESLDTCQVLKDPVSIYQTVLETLKKSSTMIIEEDYNSWKAYNYKSKMGKCLLIDQGDYTTQHIFFDDGARPGEDCIVDVRDITTGLEIPYDKFINMYVCLVRPTEAVTQMDYFIKCIERAESLRDDEI